MDAREAVAQAAGALRDQAAEHKRASAYHRKQARRCMEQYAELCRSLGIGLKKA